MTVIAAAITVMHAVALGTFGGLGIHLDINYSCNFEMTPWESPPLKSKGETLHSSHLKCNW